MSFVIDCINGNDNSEILKNIEIALEKLKNKETLILMEGIYPGINIEIDNKSEKFEYCVIGSGIKTELCQIIHNGKINCSFKNVKVKDINLTDDESITFEDVEFYGNNCLTSSKTKNTQLRFVNCIFGINYQLMIKKGIFNISFLNCVFRKKRRIPIILCKYADINIKITDCKFDVELIHNDKSIVNIECIDCNFNSIFSGESCITNINNNQKSNRIEQCNNDVDVIAKTINTNQKSKIKLTLTVEFVYLKGSNPIVIDLPTNAELGHRIEIHKKCPFIVIDNRYYYGNFIRIVRMENEWLIF